MDRYIGRCVDCLVERDLGIFGAVLIQGPKWCGKTTTAQRFAESSLSLSDPSGGFAALQLARLDPAQAIVGPTPRLVDEWQEEPKLWDAVRFECDVRGGEPGQFILTGSATPRAENQPMHSGVGRSRLVRCSMAIPLRRHSDPSPVSPVSRICSAAAVGPKRSVRQLPTQCG